MNAPLDRLVESRLHTAFRSAIPDLHRYCRDSWTLIGSAAAWLLGADVVVADVDVLTTVRDAQMLRERWLSRASSDFVPADAKRFRSDFGRYDFAGLPFEVMGGLEVAGKNGWESVAVGEIVSVNVFGLMINIPSGAEQIRILNTFGRPKDLQRSTLLESLTGHPSC